MLQDDLTMSSNPSNESLFTNAPDIVPPVLRPRMSVADIISVMESTCFEARNVSAAARLLCRMIDDGDTIWLGIAGAGIAGGMGGMVRTLIKAGFVDAICSTGAQVYHDLHFAFDLPVKQIPPRSDDDALRRHGDTRIYDIGIREVETLQRQDEIILEFIGDVFDNDLCIPSWRFNRELGLWTAKKSIRPEHSFVVAAAENGVPIFWDSTSNHSIAMNMAKASLKRDSVRVSSDADIIHSAAIVYSSDATGFVELGGGGPKNFIQQTGPTLSQILGIHFEGADRGLQIGTATEREGSLSGCSFGEAVTWGKYRSDEPEKLVQVWGDYSVIFPLLAAFAMDQCKPRSHKRLTDRLPELVTRLEGSVR